MLNDQLQVARVGAVISDRRGHTTAADHGPVRSNAKIPTEVRESSRTKLAHTAVRKAHLQLIDVIAPGIRAVDTSTTREMLQTVV